MQTFASGLNGGMKKLILIIAGTALAAGAYFLGPNLFLPWSRVFPPIRYGLTFWYDAIGSSRWLAIASLALVWRTLGIGKPREPSEAHFKRKNLIRACLLVPASLAVAEVMMLVLILFDQMIWFDADYAPFFATHPALWINLLVPINMLTVPLGFALDCNTGFTINLMWSSDFFWSWTAGWVLAVVTWAAGFWLFRRAIHLASARALPEQIKADPKALFGAEKFLLLALFLAFYFASPIDLIEGPTNLLEFAQGLVYPAAHTAVCTLIAFAASWLYFKAFRYFLITKSEGMAAAEIAEAGALPQPPLG